MKTPRLPLNAILAFALASSAFAAELPTWTVIEEGTSSWPTISFKVGNENRSLQCRYAECGPNAPKKAQINLYLLTKKGAGTPTTVTTYDGVERSKWNPRRYTDGKYDYVPRKIKAEAFAYDSELSYFKLDNTGAALAVVQGSARYPATNSSYSAGYYGYDQMRVAPPKKMGDDEIKPGAPATPAKTTWWCKQSTGEIVGVQPGHKPPEGYTRLNSRSSKCGNKPATGGSPDPHQLRRLSTAGNWKDAVRPVEYFRSIKTSAWPLLGVAIPVPGLNFYCYHEKMDGDKDLKTHLKKHSILVECVNWAAPKDDATKEDAGKKYKIRNNSVVFDLGVVNGKLQVLGGVAKGVVVTENSTLPDSLGGEKFVKVTGASGPEAPANGALSAKELTWLEKSHRGVYEAAERPKEPAALTAFFKKYRDMIVENLEPNADAIGKYKAALADPNAKAGAADEALPPVWGGDNKAVVGLSGPLTDIQLSDAEYKALVELSKGKGNEGPAHDYAFARGFWSGAGKDGKTFDESKYDPIVLHKTVIKARALLPKTPEAKPGDISDAPLTDKEIALLTPKEKLDYEKALKNVKDKVPGAEKYLAELSRTLRKKIIDEKRGETAAYVPPKNLEEFKKLADWQKTKFCDPKSEAGQAVADAGPKQSDTQLNAGKDANVTLGKVDAQLKTEAAAGDQKGATQASGGLPDWAKGPCAEHLARMNPAPGNGNGGTNPPGNIAGKIEHGKDAEIKAKEPNPWLTMDLGLAAVKGGMVGLLVGSLFGPVGLVAGPLIGAAIFYGATKLQS